MRTTASVFKAAVLLTVIGAISSAYANDPISWQIPFTISGDSDVSTDGNLVAAFNMNGPAITVNGVFFASFPVTAGTADANSGNFAFHETQGPILLAPTNLGSTQAPFSNLSANYQTLLSTGLASNELDLVVLTISGLTIGRQYEFQFWVNGSTLVPNQTVFTTASDGNLGIVNLDGNTTDTNGGVGQTVIGIFTATSGTEMIDFGGPSPGPTINAFELRDIGAVPEPSTLIQLASGSILLAGIARRKLRR
jgi:hypothetical protein